MKFQKGQPKSGGRQRGTQNRATVEIKEFWQEFFENEEYRTSLKARIMRGKAQEIEKLLYFYAYGKPKEQVEVSGTGGHPVAPPVVFYLPHNNREINATSQP